jgi:hypothetical protein
MKNGRGLNFTRFDLTVLPFLTGKPFSTTKDTKVTKGKCP